MQFYNILGAELSDLFLLVFQEQIHALYFYINYVHFVILLLIYLEL